MAAPTQGADRLATDPQVPPEPDKPPSKVDAAMGVWARVQEHKIIQWGLAYLGAALALAHGQELVGHAFNWPEGVARVLMALLIVGFPVALTLAWYHGHRGLKNIGTAEFMIISLLLLIGAVFFTVALRSSPERGAEAAREDPVAAAGPGAGSPSRTAPSTPQTVLANSIAVLPLENLSSEPDKALIAAGFHNEILDQLTKLHNLTVIARPAVLRYTENPPPLHEIARELNVRWIMQGSVRYAGESVRVHIELIDPQTGADLWSAIYTEKFDDVFSVESDIAMNVANALKVRFSGEEQEAIERIPTASAEAHVRYLQASAFQNAAANDPRIVDLLSSAIEIDPNFALALAWRARLRAESLVNTIYGSAVDPRERAEREAIARKDADRAISLDPKVRLAHGAIAILAFYKWHWSEAAQAFDRALEAAPNDEDARGYYGYLLSYLGRHTDSIHLLERGLELNPDTRFPRGYSLGYAGRYDEAAVQWRASIRSAEARGNASASPLYHQWLAYMEIAQGNGAVASNDLDLSERLVGANPPLAMLPEMAYGYSRLGRKDDAKRLFDEVKDAADAGMAIGAGSWAAAYLAIGDEKKALEWLTRVAEKASQHEPDPGFFNAMNLKMNITNSDTLKKPEFVAVLNRLRGD
jgi:TolB-like protein/tetratricopeptide (TPR) repeat protein